MAEVQPPPNRLSPQTLLAGLIAILLVTNIAWFTLGGHPQHWDSAIHLSESLAANRIGSDSTSSLLHQALSISWYYPPFVSYTAVPVYRILGESELAGVIVMTLYFILFVLCTYLTGSLLFERTTGLLAAVFVAGSAIVLQYSRMFMLDLPLAAMASASFYLLIKTESFSRPVMSLILGIIIGCGVLTKWTFPLYIIVPVLYFFLRGFGESRHKSRRTGYLLLTAGAAVLVAAPWYLVHAIPILLSRGGELERGPMSLAGHALYYLASLPAEISLAGLAVLAAGICFYFWGTGYRQPLLLFWFGGAYVLLSCIGFKQPRFAIPLLEPLVLIAAAGFVHRANASHSARPAGSLFVSFPMALFILQILLCSFIPEASATGRFLSGALAGASIVVTDGPERDDWRQQTLAAAVDHDRTLRGKPTAVVRVIPDFRFYNNATIGYAAKLLRLPLVIAGTTGYPLLTDYVLLKSEAVGVDSQDRDRERLTHSILADTADPRSTVRCIGRWILPDSSLAILVRLEPQTVDTPPPVILGTVDSLADSFVRRYLRPLNGYTLVTEGYSAAQTQSGRLKSMRIHALEGELGDFAFNPTGIPVNDVEIVLNDVQIDVRHMMRSHELQILSVAGLHVDGMAVTSSDLRAYAEKASRGDVIIDSLSIDGGILHLEGRSQKFTPRFSVDLSVNSVGDRNLEFSFRKISIGGIPVPAFLVNVLLSSYNPLITGLDGIPDVRLGRLSLAHGELRVGPPDR